MIQTHVTMFLLFQQNSKSKFDENLKRSSHFLATLELETVLM